jgi:hypothetical protein
MLGVLIRFLKLREMLRGQEEFNSQLSAHEEEPDEERAIKLI